METNYTQLENLAVALAQAKAAEEQAKEARIKAEEALVNAARAINGLEIKSDGSTSFKAGQVKVTVKNGWSYKVSDIEEFSKRFPACVKTETKFSEALYKKMSDKDKLEAEKYVTATPKKTAVELKL